MTTNNRTARGALIALAMAGAVAIAVPTAAVAATTGVGDVTDAMRYDVSAPYGSPLGDLVDADDQTETTAISWPLNFFGAPYGALCVTTNGGVYPVADDSVDCSNSYDEDLENLALSSGAPMIAALAGDNDPSACFNTDDDGWGLPCQIYFGEATIEGRDAIIVTWYRVPMYDDDNDSALSNTYQIVLLKRDTGDDTVGWDFDIEFNYGTVADGEDGYSAADPSTGCPLDDEDADSFGDPDCRWGIGWANFTAGDPDTADPYELFAGAPVADLLDGALNALTGNSLNSPVLGRYTFSMVGGVTQGFAVPTLNVASETDPELAETGVDETLAGSAGLAALLLVLAGSALVVRRRAAHTAR